MNTRSPAGKRARVITSTGGRDSPVREFLKWLAGMVAEKLITTEANKKSPMGRK
jgi:hypothetical protein